MNLAIFKSHTHFYVLNALIHQVSTPECPYLTNLKIYVDEICICGLGMFAHGVIFSTGVDVV